MKKLILIGAMLATMSARALTGAEETALIGLAAGALGYGGATATNGLAPLQFLGLQAGKTRLGKWMHGASGPKDTVRYEDFNHTPLTNGIIEIRTAPVPLPVVITNALPVFAPVAATNVLSDAEFKARNAAFDAWLKAQKGTP